MLQRFIFVVFSRPCYPLGECLTNLKIQRTTGRPMEEILGQEALKLGLREAVMACLCGGRVSPVDRWELLERFKALGICASRTGVTGALAELEVELELCPWAPWRLLERRTEWILAPKSEVLALLWVLLRGREKSD
jgi:hypothetical protein